ncbi:hypothetical protein RM555_04065 [Micromonospora sp. DSM 115977]|uniref:Uncharacterized protein n=1 Tax=Micromonospora reichwaldensis TaxID=3075516 RepID=A0ABU2WQH4_9ACTN|nr:hypothetical protein [Micromonospora sp. DSM 115977]MDT0528168.1 hypothetical protein [Micromonospora sp. DSM 115977]
MGRLMDRRRDVAGWLVTPLFTLVAAPVLACIAGMVASPEGGANRTPALCEKAVAENMCEETTLGVIGLHVAISGAMWLLLWAIPWWRGLRTLRVALAVIATVVLVLLPVRMVA